MGLQPGKNHDYSHSDYSGTNWLVYNDYTMINILNCQVIKYLDGGWYPAMSSTMAC